MSLTPPLVQMPCLENPLPLQFLPVHASLTQHPIHTSWALSLSWVARMPPPSADIFCLRATKLSRVVSWSCWPSPLQLLARSLEEQKEISQCLLDIPEAPQIPMPDQIHPWSQSEIKPPRRAPTVSLCCFLVPLFDRMLFCIIPFIVEARISQQLG